MTDRERLEALLAERKVPNSGLHATTRGRLTAINGRRIDPESYTDMRSRRLAAREYSLGFSAAMQPDNRIRAGRWWLDAPELAVALRQVRAFIENIKHNFGEQSPAWQEIQSSEHRAGRKQQIMQALMNYRAERDAWDRLF